MIDTTVFLFLDSHTFISKLSQFAHSFTATGIPDHKNIAYQDETNLLSGAMNSKRIKSKKNDNVTDSVIKSKKTSDRSKPFRGRIFSIASQRNDVKYAWPDDEIQMAEQISQEEQRYLFGTLRRPARNFGRTTTDNEIDMVAYMNNQQTWNASASRFLFFSAACLGLSALIMLYWSSYLSSVSEGLSFKQHIAKEGSISGMYRDKGTPSAPNRMFEAFMSAAALVILFSNFGFYLLPRWENEKSLNSRADRVGWCASECFRMFICFNYKRIESTSNWVVGEEGRSIMYLAVGRNSPSRVELSVLSCAIDR
jgi:hypothetical protein